MDIRAILLIGGLDGEAASRAEHFGNIPLACLDVLGMSVEERIIRRLQHFGVSLCSAVCDAPREAYRFTQCAALDSRVQHPHEAGEQFWQTAEQTFHRCAEDGAELVIVYRVGPYVEVDYEELIQHHLDRRNCVTQAVDPEKTGLDAIRVKCVAPGRMQQSCSRAACSECVESPSLSGLRVTSIVCRRPAICADWPWTGCWREMRFVPRG